MSRGIIKYIYRLVTVLAVAVYVVSCSGISDIDLEHEEPSVNTHNPGDRVPSEETRNVLLMYAAGFNSLSSFLKSDISDLKSGWLPRNHRSEDILLVYSHLTSGSYKNATSPVLTRIYADNDGDVVTDTLVVYEKGTISSSDEQLETVLEYVKDKFPAKGYGMVFSSHATGYLPSGYYTNSSEFENSLYFSRSLYAMPGAGKRPVPYVEPCYDPSLPMTKSIGQDVGYAGEDRVSYEMDLVDFANAIPMYMDYILFDACLMGGVEVAYQLKDVCRYVGFSQAEVLAEGFDYTTLTSHLLQSSVPQPVHVCEDYFDQYINETGISQSATISLVDCSMLGPLADVCSRIFMQYEDSLNSLRRHDVQRYYRYDYHWFYDLESIVLKCGVDGELLDEFYDAMKSCVLYKAATPNFMGAFDIEIACGLSMFLPSDGGQYLKQYYASLAWNHATGLVK